MTVREAAESNPYAYLLIGDLDKPFHFPECECAGCEQWRRDNDRPTHGELRARLAEEKEVRK